MKKRFEDMQDRSLITSANGEITYCQINSSNNKQESDSELLWKDALIEKGFQLPTQQADFKDLFILIKKAFENKYHCLLDEQFISMYISSSDGKIPVKHDYASRVFFSSGIVYVDRLLTHYLFEYIANYYLWSRFHEEKEIYGFCFQYAINSIDKCYRQGNLNSDINVSSLVGLIKKKCDDRGIQFIADMYWSVLAFAMCHELAHAYMNRTIETDYSPLEEELHADRIGYEVYLSIIDKQIPGLSSPFLDVFHDYLYAAPVVLFLFYEDLYFMSDWLYGEKASADTHPTLKIRKEKLLQISESDSYMFDTTQGNSVLNAYWDISDEFREELFYKLKNGKLPKLIQKGYMDMRNEKGSGNALAFDLQVQEKLRSYASIKHIDEDELLGLYNIAVMYTVLGEISDHDLVYTKKDGKVVSIKGYNVQFRLGHALATIIEFGLSLADGPSWKTIAILLKILLTMDDTVEIELNDEHARVLEVCYRLGALNVEIPEQNILARSGSNTQIIDDLVRLHCLSLEDGKIKIIENIKL